MHRTILFSLICYFLVFPVRAWSGDVIELNDGDVHTIDKAQSLYVAEPRTLHESAPSAPENPFEFISSKNTASSLDRVNGGSYWLYQKFRNNTDLNRWVVNPSGSIVDSIHIYVYQNGGVQQFSRGYLYPFEHHLSYAASFDIEPNVDFEVLVFIQSRYFSYSPQVELQPLNDFVSDNNAKNFLILVCFGSILTLAVYNLLLGSWIKDKSNIYYSGFLLLSLVSWMAAFNGFSEWFQWRSHWLIISPFFLIAACNTLYIIHFLELPERNSRLARYCYGFVVLSVLFALSMPLFSMGRYLQLFAVVSVVWIVGGLYLGVKRLLEGYLPARFFVIAFITLAIGITVSSIPIIFPSIEIRNNFIVTLVMQTIEMLLLSLALADRINILRSSKEGALNKLVETEGWARKKEQEANQTLQQALALSEEEVLRKSEFLRVVSHELRTPLYSIISSVEQWDTILDEKGQKDLLEYMGYGAARLRMQVDNLVLLAETDNGSIKPVVKTFEIRSLFDTLCENTQGLLQPKVEFEYKCAGSVPALFEADSYLIEHMIRTVLDNACKYTEHGKVGFYIQWRDGMLVVQITDTGCGMSRDQERTMFNDFVQVSRGLHRESEGLGIGLTVCYRLSAALEANLNIETDLGKGTEVTIEIPVKVLGEKGLSVYPDRINQAEVLIVEDNEINSQVLYSLVNMMGAKPTIVDSGQSALEVLDGKGFDLVLMDIQMPVMDGITATRWIRRRNHVMPVVAVTANSDSVVRGKCVDVGMNDFLVKPVRRSDLQRVMERQLLAKKWM